MEKKSNSRSVLKRLLALFAFVLTVRLFLYSYILLCGFLVEEVEEEIAGYPLVAHALCVANNLLVGIVDFAAAVDVAQNAALAVAHGAIVEDIANALIVVVVDLQTLDKSDLLAVFVTNHPIAVEEADRA